MARSIESIRQSLKDGLILAASLVGLPISPDDWVVAPGNLSMTDIKVLILDAVATATGITEQLMDAYKQDVESLVLLAAPETGLWWQHMMINVFQFNSSTPQVPKILPPNYNISYEENNDDYKIIKYCSVNFIDYGRVQIKVAAQVAGLPEDVDTVHGAGTLDTARSFANTISDGTIIKIVQSGAADRAMIKAQIYFNGLHAATIQNDVKNAIKTYLSTKTSQNPTGIPFDGVFDLTDLERVLKSVPGVISFVLNDVNLRANATAFTPGSYNMVLGNRWITRNFQLVAGYCKTEDTIGYTIDDTLTFIPQ